MPTFAPKINQKSKKIATALQQKYEERK